MTSFGLRLLLIQTIFFFASCELVLIQKTANAIDGSAQVGKVVSEPYKWTEFKFKYSPGYAAGVKKHFTSLTDAQAQCTELGVEYCQAVTCNKQGSCTLRGSSTLKNSPFGERTYLVDGAGSVTSCNVQGGCAVYDDQHVAVFDGPKMSLLADAPQQLPDTNEHLIKLIAQESSGDVWLVKSSTVKIQARFLPDEAHPNKVKVKALAVGGAFLNGSKLIIEPLNGKVTWDGIEILTEAESEFLGDGAINAKRHDFSCLVQDMTKRGPGIDVKLPKGVKLTVNRQASHVNVHINMPHLGGDQDGLCGNNNGDSSDDAVDQIIKRRSPSILAKESLLPHIPKDFIKSVYNVLTGGSLQSRAVQPNSHTQTASDCSANSGGCAAYDDQNVVVFDGPKISQLMDKHSSGDMWLVKSHSVHIQARYLPDDEHANKLKVRAVAVGGAFLGGSKLVIEPMNGKVTWDDAEILADAHSEFHHGAVSAQRHDFSCLVEDMSKQSPGIDVNLPNGVKLTVNRQEKHVNVHITMPHITSQDGLCGNNNGDASDDQVELIIEKRHPTVAAAASLFPPISSSIFKSVYNSLPR